MARIGSGVSKINREFASRIAREDKAIARDLTRETNRMAGHVKQAERM